MRGSTRAVVQGESLAVNLVLYRLRSGLLRTLVPDVVWPQHVSIDGAKIKVRNAPYSFGVKLALKRDQHEGQVDHWRIRAGGTC